MEKAPVTNLSGPGVMDKYRDAGTIAQKVLKELITKCVVGADIAELCQWGNDRILEETSKIYAKKKFSKGIAFPVCISPSSTLAYYSPLKDESKKIEDGQVLKIELGVQIDNFPSLIAHTIVVGTCDDKKQKLLSACYQALQNAVKVLRPDKQNYEVTQVIQKVVESFGFKTMRGVLMHNLDQGVLDGQKVIQTSLDSEDKVDNLQLEVNQVYALDIMVTTGDDARGKSSENRTTVFKKNVDVTVDLKTKTSRQFLNEALNKYGEFAFSIADWSDQMTARVGLSECLKTNHFQPLDLLEDKNNGDVVRFMWTVGMLGGRNTLLCSCQENQFTLEQVQTEDENLKKVLDKK